MFVSEKRREMKRKKKREEEREKYIDRERERVSMHARMCYCMQECMFV